MSNCEIKKSNDNEILIKESFCHTEHWYRQTDYKDERGILTSSFSVSRGHKAPFVSIHWCDIPKQIQIMFWKEQRKDDIRFI